MDLTLLDVARAYLGEHERAGELDNPLVQHWLSLCELDEDAHDEVPWCSAALVGWVHVFGGRVPSSRSARARSWLDVGRRVPLSEARPGWDVVVLGRGPKPYPGVVVRGAPGHVTLFAGWSDSAPGSFAGLGGNQKDSVSCSLFSGDDVLAVQRLVDET